MEIKAALVGTRRLNEFNLNVLITRQTTEEAKGPAKPGVPATPATKEKQP